MSYRCQVCEEKVRGNQPLQRHIIKRADGQIAREIPCCLACCSLFNAGMPIEQVRRIGMRGKTPPAPPPPVVQAPLRAPKYHPVFFQGQVPVVYKDVKKK